MRIPPAQLRRTGDERDGLVILSINTVAHAGSSLHIQGYWCHNHHINPHAGLGANLDRAGKHEDETVE